MMRSAEAYTGTRPYLYTLETFLKSKGYNPFSVFNWMIQDSRNEFTQVFTTDEWCDWAEHRLARDGYIGSIVSESFIQSGRLLTEMVDFRILVNSLRKKGVLKIPTASLESMLEPTQPTASIRGTTGTRLYGMDFAEAERRLVAAERRLVAYMRGGVTQPLRHTHDWLHYLED